MLMLMRVRRRYRNRRSNRKIDLIHHQINHKALETLPMATTRPSYTKLTCPSPTTGARGHHPRFHAGDEVPYTERPIVRSQETGRSTSCAFPPTTTSTPSQPEGTTTLPSLQSITDNNGTPATWTLVLSSSKSLTGRTGHRLRDASVYWNYWRYTLDTGILPQPDKDSSYYDDMPCRTPIH